jgi:antitoxin HigA-1
MAWKLSQSLGAGPNFWLNLQNNWELSQVKVKPIKKLALRAA